MKKPLTVSIDEEMIRWIDSKIDGNGFRNRSHLVEKVLMKFKEEVERKVSSEEGSILKKKIENYKNELKEDILKERLSIMEKDLNGYKADLEEDILDKLLSIKAKKEILKKISKKE